MNTQTDFKAFLQNVAPENSYPAWLPESTILLVKGGSTAYGAAQDFSDLDLYGVAVPPLEVIFPHLAGEIPGFSGHMVQRFDQWQNHHLHVGHTEYDFSIYNIVKYYDLCMKGNPNMVDTLFVPDDCILLMNEAGEMIRDIRHFFLHKGCISKYIGFAKGELNNLDKPTKGKKSKLIKDYGYDTKAASHTIRLLKQAEQILNYHTLVLDRDKDLYLSIKNGHFSLEEIRSMAGILLNSVNSLLETSSLQEKPDKIFLRNHLYRVIEMVYPGLQNQLIPSFI